MSDDRDYEIASADRVLAVHGGGRTYTANVLGENLVDTIPTVEEYKLFGSEIPVGDESVRALYGDRDGVTVLVDADDEEDAERRIIATFSDAVTIDDLQEVAVSLGADDLADAADAIGLFAGIDEGEHTDYDRLKQLEERLRRAAGSAKGQGVLAPPDADLENGPSALDVP